MRRAFTTLIAALAMASLLATTAMPAAAADYEVSPTVTIDQVRVNRMGGITINGTVDCTADVTAMYDGAIPENTTMFVNVNWEASQMVGKNNVIYATYLSGIASICYTNDPAFAAGLGTWQTLFPFPTGTEQWVYSRDGKFSPGPIHVEIYVYGGPFAVGEDNYAFYTFGQRDLRATRSR